MTYLHYLMIATHLFIFLFGAYLGDESKMTSEVAIPALLIAVALSGVSIGMGLV